MGGGRCNASALALFCWTLLPVRPRSSKYLMQSLGWSKSLAKAASLVNANAESTSASLTLEFGGQVVQALSAASGVYRARALQECWTLLIVLAMLRSRTHAHHDCRTLLTVLAMLRA
eukprot:605293-Amphidinium_carterae.1